ncbi:MAG: helicase C-terminal domain-containing protein [Candidatus Dormibacteraceae bacterium]
MLEYAALDLETTGLDPQRDRVIELGAVAFTSEAVLETLHRLVSPGRPVPPAVLALTGIEPAELSEAEGPDVALPRLADFLRGRQPVGHGAALDADFMRAAGHWDPHLEVLDTLHLARILLPGAPSHSLPVLAAALGLSQPRPHRALDDAEATRQLLMRLREEAAGLAAGLKESILAAVAPYPWSLARFFAEALAAAPASVVGPNPGPGPDPEPGRERRHHKAPTDVPAALTGMLGPSGPLASSLPDYEYRESQVQMLLAVSQIMRRGGRLVVEAGTGTGKSLAYLIPALGRARAAGERVVVSTNTHTLQEQLMAKDLPALREWLPWDFEACLLKGRPNYISLRRWRRHLAERCRDSEELEFKLKVLVWLDRTSTGDRAELRLQGAEEALWARIASDPLDCAGLHCTPPQAGAPPRSTDCYVHLARERAEAADLVVVNHALLLADAVRGGGVLPHYDHLVIDEAHHLEEAATQGLREEVDGPGLSALLDRLLGERAGPAPVPRRSLLDDLAARPGLFASDPDLKGAVPLAEAARERAAQLFRAAEDWLRAGLGERDDSVRLVPAARAGERWERMRAGGVDAVTALAALDARLRRVVASGRDWLGGDEGDQALRDLETTRSRLAAAADVVRAALLDPKANSVYWLTLPSRTGVLALRSAPLNVGGLLRERVFAPRSSVVFTSASLAVGGGFDYFRSRVGLEEQEVETLILPSPFDYLRQVLVCLPTDLPETQSQEFDAALVPVIAAVASRIGGGTLALFTSHRQLRDTYHALKQRRDLDGVLILAPGLDGPRRQVLRSFSQTPRSLLLGTASFWEGIDLPGDQLSCVILARLPFPVPTEPVFAARSELVRDPFRSYALPQAALRLKQGFGRLIRRSTDRGAVVILDPRISNRDYGRAFLDVLPPASMFSGPAGEVGDRVADWLGAQQGGASGDAAAPPGA